MEGNGVMYCRLELLSDEASFILCSFSFGFLVWKWITGIELMNE